MLVHICLFIYLTLPTLGLSIDPAGFSHAERARLLATLARRGDGLFPHIFLDVRDDTFNSSRMPI